MPSMQVGLNPPLQIELPPEGGVRFGNLLGVSIEQGFTCN